MNLTLAVEIALSVLLAATLVYCALLERRLAALRKGQDGFRETIGELNTAIGSAGASMRLLKATTGNAAETLDERLARARAMIDELSLLTTSGERIAARIERGAAAQPDRPAVSPAARSRTTPAVLANRLDALKPQILRPDTARSTATGNVR
ncbi:MAG: DUF6468 domain-containing protein [Rhizomicrobium sp.]